MTTPNLLPGSLPDTQTVGADLDLTLIDTRDATAVALREVNSTCGESVDINDFISRLGLPIRDELARWIPQERVPEAVKVFREVFLAEGLQHLTALPGATDLAANLRERGRRLVVITSRIPRIAQACLDAVGLYAAVVVGGVTGPQKAQPMVEYHVGVYLGDHPLDMLGAQSAKVPGVGVTTGAHTREQLLDAGATWVIDSLKDLLPART